MPLITSFAKGRLPMNPHLLSGRIGLLDLSNTIISSDGNDVSIQIEQLRNENLTTNHLLQSGLDSDRLVDNWV